MLNFCTIFLGTVYSGKTDMVMKVVGFAYLYMMTLLGKSLAPLITVCVVC